MTEQREQFTIDTVPALRALYNELGDSFREVGRVLGVSHTHLWHVLEGDRNPISVNLLARYAQEARKKAGISMQLLIDAEGNLKYKIDRD